MDTIVSALPRDNLGRGGARRLRRESRVPAIVYGRGEPVAVSCDARDIIAHIREEGVHSTLFDLQLGDQTTKVLIREVQMHPYRNEVLHVDFQAVREDSAIAASVPLHFINVEDAPGIKLHHGIFTAVENEVAVHCFPKDLPDAINVDIGGLDIGKNIHLNDLPVPEGVSFDALVRGENPVLAIISEAKVQEESTGTEGESAVVSEGGDTAS